MYNRRQKALHEKLWRVLESFAMEWDAIPEEVMEVWDKTGQALRVAMAKKKGGRKKGDERDSQDGDGQQTRDNDDDND